VLEERDGGWMIVEMLNDKVEDGIERRQQVHLKLKLGDDSYAYTGWFTVYDVKGFEIILGKRWVCDINGTYHINHRTNEMWITQGDITLDDREKAPQIHCHHGLWPHSKPDDGTIKEAARTISIEIIGKKQLHRMDHRVLARAFIVRVRYKEPESAQPPDTSQCMHRDFLNCGFFAATT